MLVKIEARILIFPSTDFHFPSTSVPPGTFLGSASQNSHQSFPGVQTQVGTFPVGDEKWKCTELERAGVLGPDFITF